MPARRTAADLAVVGARIRTGDPARPWATAVAVRDGVFAVVGDDAEVRAACDAATCVVDARGTHLVPGLVDAHCHPLWGSRAARDADLSSARSLEDARAELARVAADRGPGDWVIGHGLRRGWFGDGPRAAAIEDAVGGRPAFLTFRDGHGALATRAALAAAGITGAVAFGDASQVVCDPDGTPTGELREPTAMEAVRTAFPQQTPEQRRERYLRTLRDMAAMGITGAHVMDDHPNDAGDLAAMDASGRLPVRLLLHVWVKPEMDDDALEDAVRRGSAPGGGRWRTGALKFFLDGVVGSGTAWLKAPDTRGEGTHPFWPDPERYRRAVALGAAAGLGCTTHAIGDRAIEVALAAYAAAPPRATPGRTARHRVEHVETLDPADLPRFAAHGVAASMQPLHCEGVRPGGDDDWSRRLGPGRPVADGRCATSWTPAPWSRWDPTGR
ncbi:MAG: amidohydrolase family protein [Thermoleophilia bacterium]